MFCKDSRQENFLTAFGVAWKYMNAIKYSDLSPNWEQANLGRSEATVSEIVLEYAARTEAGSSAPAPILRRTAKGYDVSDGVQRLSAEQLLGTTIFSAYVVDTDSDLTADKIRVMANHLLSGHPESNEWNRRRAIEVLINDGGMSIDEVARLGGWKRKDVEQDKTYIDFGFAIRCIGGPQVMTKGVVMALADHAKLDDFRVAPKPIAEFCDDLKRGRFSNGESVPFVKAFFDVNRAARKTLHDQFTKRLETFRDDPEVQIRLSGRSPQRRKDDIRLRAAMKAAKTVTDDLVQVGATIVYLDEFYQLWNQVDANLKRLGKHSIAKAMA